MISDNSLKVEWDIQPVIKDGNIGVLFKGLLIQIIPFGMILVFFQGLIYVYGTTTHVYINAPNVITDKSLEKGYKIKSYSIIKSNQTRPLTADEIKMNKRRGRYYLLSIPLFFAIAYLIYSII